MRPDKSKALKLRLQGRSYNEITALLGVPRSTLSGWFGNLEISPSARERISKRVHAGSLRGLIKKNKLQTHAAEQKARAIRLQGAMQINNLSKSELRILGATLYWAEGYKRPIIRNGKARTSHPVSLSNSDPFLVQAFLKFLRNVCEVPEEKIGAQLRIYEHQNAKNLLNFWSKTTGIPKNKFEKFYYGVSKSSQGKRPFNILPYGTIQIRVNSTALYHQIMGMIE